MDTRLKKIDDVKEGGTSDSLAVREWPSDLIKGGVGLDAL
jgi:hypothetical protein